jgi:hypothetical protein
VDARRAPKRVFDAHLPDQCAKVRVDLRSPSQWARPTPVAAKAGPMPTDQRLGTDDRGPSGLMETSDIAGSRTSDRCLRV